MKKYTYFLSLTFCLIISQSIAMSETINQNNPKELKKCTGNDSCNDSRNNFIKQEIDTINTSINNTINAAEFNNINTLNGRPPDAFKIQIGTLNSTTTDDSNILGTVLPSPSPFK